MSIKNKLRAAYISMRRVGWDRCKAAGRPVPLRVTDEHIVSLLPWGDIPWLLYAYGPLFRWRRNFENGELAYFIKSISKGMTIIDVGANIGLYSILGSKLTGETGKVYAFEPAVETFGFLQKNIECNQRTNVVAVRRALSDRVGRAQIRIPMTAPKGLGDAYRYIDYSDAAGGGLYDEQVELVTLDQFAEQNGVSRIDFLKVDVEGTQINVLRGARRLLERSPACRILFECPEKVEFIEDYKQIESFNFLRELGFAIFSVATDSGKLDPIGPGADGTGNYVAMRPDPLGASRL